MTDAQQVYLACAEANTDSVEQLLICLTEKMMDSDKAQMANIERNRLFTRNMFILFAAALTFFMQAGFAMVCAGCVRRKNLQNTMLKNLLDAAGASIAFYAVGYAFALGDSETNPNLFIGTTNFFLIGVEDVGIWVYQYAFSAASATIVAGTLAERCQMSAYFYYSMFLTGFVYPVVVHSIWSQHGFISGYQDSPFLGVGFLDIAGGGVVHLTGGLTSLIATWVLGPRRGRFHDEETGEVLAKPKNIQGHSIGLQLLGTMILWFGWYGFNAGSAYLHNENFGDHLATIAATNTTLSAGAGGLSALFINYLITRRLDGRGKYDLVATMNGVLTGLVAITGGCCLMAPFAAVITGSIAGGIYLAASSFLVRNMLDDAVDAMPVHMAGGIWGLLATGLFAKPDLQALAFEGRNEHPGIFYQTDGKAGDFTLIGVQIIGILWIIGWTTATMLPFFIFLNSTGQFRANAIEEVLGLDKAYFGEEQKGDLELANNDEELEKITKKVEAQIVQRRRDHSAGHASSHSQVSSRQGSVPMVITSGGETHDD